MAKKQLSTKKGSLDTAGYNTLLDDIRSILDKGLSRAYQAVDNIKVQTYWQIGERIVREELKHKDRADYGKKIISRLVGDLGIDRRELYRIVLFYRVYPIVVTVSPQLSWSHYIELIKLENKEQRRFYETQTIKNGWSIRDLRTNIKKDNYTKQKKAGTLDLSLPSTLPAPREIFKNVYDWDFVELEEKHSEKDLEDALLLKIEKVLLELGAGFAFVGRQQKVLINGKWERVDLLFYHIALKCHVIVELKARALDRGDVEQVTRYLTYYRDHKIDGDRDPIALIICKSFNEIDVYYSAGKDRDDIFVAEYKTKLPKEDEIKKRLKKSI
jgi:predicted nuclease of restriction endonuclease-like (RecB) superfamily